MRSDLLAGPFLDYPAEDPVRGLCVTSRGEPVTPWQPVPSGHRLPRRSASRKKCSVTYQAARVNS